MIYNLERTKYYLPKFTGSIPSIQNILKYKILLPKSPKEIYRIYPRITTPNQNSLFLLA